MTDDQGPWALGCAGTPELRTPVLDQMAAEGMRFENFYCTSPVCSAAGASMLTGRIPSNHGVLDWLRDGAMKGDQKHKPATRIKMPLKKELMETDKWTGQEAKATTNGVNATRQKVKSYPAKL